MRYEEYLATHHTICPVEDRWSLNEKTGIGLRACDRLIAMREWVHSGRAYSEWDGDDDRNRPDPVFVESADDKLDRLTRKAFREVAELADKIFAKPVTIFVQEDPGSRIGQQQFWIIAKFADSSLLYLGCGGSPETAWISARDVLRIALHDKMRGEKSR